MRKPVKKKKAVKKKAAVKRIRIVKPVEKATLHARVSFKSAAPCHGEGYRLWWIRKPDALQALAVINVSLVALGHRPVGAGVGCR